MEPKELKKRFIASMTPVGLAYELLDRAVSDLAQSLSYLDGGELETVHRLLLDAQSIFTQLKEMIRDEDAASQKAAALFGIILDHLFYANLYKERSRIEELLQLTSRLRTVYFANWGDRTTR